MTELLLSELVVAGLGPLTLRFDVGLTSILSDDVAALGALADVLVGMRAPKRGAALLDGVALASSASARTRVASLLREEQLPKARTVESSLAQVLALRGVTSTPEACLAALQLERFLSVDPSRLEPTEQNAVSFALALALAGRAALVVLHQPFALVPLVSARVIEDTCERLARERIVLVLLSELGRGLSLGARCVLLERGKVSPFGALAAAPKVMLFVRSPAAPRLAELIQQWAEASEVWVRGEEVTIGTQDPVAFSRKLVSVALEAGIDVSGLSLPNVSLHEQLWLRALGAVR